MKFIRITMNGYISWRISREAGLTLHLSWEPHFGILNPLLYPGLPSSDSVGKRFMLVDGEAAMSTQEVVLAVPDAIGITETTIDRLHEPVANFFNACRLASKQYSLPRVILSARPFELHDLPVLEFPVQGKGKVFLNSFRYGETALSWRHLERSDAIVGSGGVPVFHDLLLDAFQGLVQSDYRSAILYAAIAVESMAGEVLDGAYEKLLTKEDSAAWRFIELSVSGGGKVRKDPIYELLSSRVDFGTLLHERPLYLLQRSLLDEDQELYRIARSLYKARNRIAHKGGVASKEGGTLSENRAGAEIALKCAVDIFRWFGVESDYVFPQFGFIEGCLSE